MDYQSLTYFCRFANFLADGFPLIGIVLLDRSKQSRALLPDQYWSAAAGIRARIHLLHLLQTRRNAYPVMT